MFQKWKQYEAKGMKQLQQKISEGRSIAVEMLVKKAVAAPAPLRSRMLAEIERMMLGEGEKTANTLKLSL